MNRRKLIADSCTLGKAKNHIYFFTDLDITLFEALRKELGITSTSGHSYLLGQLVQQDYRFAMSKHHYRGLLQNAGIDVEFQVEKVIAGQRIPIGYFLRSVDTVPISELDRVVRSSIAIEEKPNTWFANLPRFLRLAIMRILDRNPRLHQEYFGTFSISSVAGISHHCGFLQPLSAGDFSVVFGSQQNMSGRTEQKTTFVFNHDLIDGAESARFIDQYQKLLLDPEMFSSNRAKRSPT